PLPQLLGPPIFFVISWAGPDCCQPLRLGVCDCEETRYFTRFPARGPLQPYLQEPCGAIFMNLLEFRARVFVMSGVHSDYPRAALSPETTLPVRLRRPREMRVPGCPSKPTGPPGPVVGCR